MMNAISTPLRNPFDSPGAASPTGGLLGSPTPRRPTFAPERRSFLSSTPSPASPMVRPPAPAPTPCSMDRYVAPRVSQDPSISHFILHSKESSTPMLLRQAFQSPVREDSVASSGLDASFSSPPRPPAQGGSRRGGAPHSAGVQGSPRLSDVFAKMHLDPMFGTGRSSNVEDEEGRSPSLTTASMSSPFAVEPYASSLARTLFGHTPQTTVLSINNPSAHYPRDEEEEEEADVAARQCRGESERFGNATAVVYENNRQRHFVSSHFRAIPHTPERILDAADILDDFYLNLIDWSSTNLLCVALQSTIYLWDAGTCGITQFPSTREANAAAAVVAGLNWAPDGVHLAAGMYNGSIDIWDATTQQVISTYRPHVGRVGALAWDPSGTVLASGSKDATICLHDVRVGGKGSEASTPPSSSGGAARPSCTMLRGHELDVCGLKWSPNNVHLASGGNDNQLLVWDRRLVRQQSAGAQGSFLYPRTEVSAPMLYLNQHKAAVKALGWNPQQPSLLASGGGSDDKTLRFWNTSTGDCVNHIDTQSQVCGLVWNRTGTELVTAHGFTENQISIWRYPSLRRVADLTGHTSRVLHVCLSADGETVVSAAADETLRFWRCFPPSDPREPSPGKQQRASVSGMDDGLLSHSERASSGSPYFHEGWRSFSRDPVPLPMYDDEE